MRWQSKFAILLGLSALVVSISPAATISGTIKGPDGAPFEGAFIQAQNAKSKITVSVLSDKQGHYQVSNLPAGEYELRIRAIGYKADPRPGVALTAAQNSSADFALQKGMVRWNDLSLYQGKVLLPESKGKDVLYANCFDCHGFETRMASVTRDEDGWRDRVHYMKTAMHFFLQDRITPEKEDQLVSFLTLAFGPDSKKPASPAELPAYEQNKLGPFTDESMKIVYVEYELPGPNRMPWSAVQDKDGNYWIPYNGDANKIARLNAKTAQVEEYTVPNQGTAGVHSAVPAADGTVWFTEQGADKLGKWDPATKEITEYQAAYAPGKEGTMAGGSKHTLRILPNGEIWSSGGPLSKFDPVTHKFTNFPQIPSVYGVAVAPDGNVWFAEFGGNHKIGRADPKTLQIQEWAPPTQGAHPRRIQVDTDGIVWFAEYEPGKIGRFDPKTETFKEFTLPGEEPTPYALGIDRDHYIWFSSDHMDYVGRLDPKTGDVVQYPYTHSENTMREFFVDKQGRMWFTSPSNNKVGYFYLAADNQRASN